MDGTTVKGLHHVTCICGDAQANLDFYGGVLGMRLVKRTVNQDVPGTYHLFYADGAGTPGTDLTFFSWPDMQPGRRGAGLASEVLLAVPAGSLAWWEDRLQRAGRAPEPPGERFGEAVVRFRDPDGMLVALVETGESRDFAPWPDGPVPIDHQVRGLHAVRLRERDLDPTAGFLRDALGFELAGEEGFWHRFGVAGGGSGRWLEVLAHPEARRGGWGTGAIHHVAFRVADDAEQLAVRERAVAAGAAATPVIDRFWFRSVYFRGPGGVLCELATDGPGFTVDEGLDRLGESLVLPPWLEPRRAEIEGALAPLELRSATL